MINLKKLTRNDLKNFIGGVGQEENELSDSSSCTAGCGATITGCNGTCSATENSVTCSGPTKTLTKTC